MGFNRIVDRKFDALNPRTAQRHLPKGQITMASAWVLVCLSAAGVALGAWGIYPLCFRLSPLGLLVVCFYSYTKQFTDFSHFFLGLALGIAPLGAWLAVRGEFDWPPIILAGAVVFWLVGFDIIYATQDYEFDKEHGLHSLPVRLGITGSLCAARAAHRMTAGLLLAFSVVFAPLKSYYPSLSRLIICLTL